MWNPQLRHVERWREEGPVYVEFYEITCHDSRFWRRTGKVNLREFAAMDLAQSRRSRYQLASRGPRKRLGIVGGHPFTGSVARRSARPGGPPRRSGELVQSPTDLRQR